MDRRHKLVLVATILGTAVAFLDGTIVNLALPKIGASLHASFSDFQWIVDGYLLSLSALILLGGSLGDIFGRKKVYLTGLVGFGLTSVICALAPSARILIAIRVIQGIFGALLVPGALAIINTNFPKHLRGKAIGIWTAFGSVAAVLGPLIGGSILEVASWRYIFLINIPIVILCLFFAVPFIIESQAERERKIDYFGALLAVASLAGITFGLIEGPLRHWSYITIAAIVAGIIFSIAFVIYESRHPDPMVQLKLFKSRNFTGSNLMTFAMYGALSGFIFALVIYLQQQMKYSSLQAGFSMMPVSIFMFFFAGKTGALAAKYGPRLFMTVGPIISSLGMLWLYFLKPGQSYLLGVLPGAVLFAIGLVTTVAPLTTTVMTSVDDANSGIASGINNAVSRAAGLIVIAVLGLLGSQNVYHFSMLLCAGLAASAGAISFFVIEDFKLAK